MVSNGSQITSSETLSDALKPLFIVCGVYIALDVIFLIIRFTSRLLVRRSDLGWDDWFLIPAFIFNIGACIIGILFGKAFFDVATVTDIHVVSMLKLSFSFVLVVIPGFTFARLSILTLYLRIFSGRKTRLSSWSTIAAVLAMGVSYEIASIFLCHPVQSYWQPQNQSKSCGDLNLFFRAFCLPNILIDLAILSIPMPAVWTLQANIGRKMGLTFMFFTFSIALIASCIRWAFYATANAASLQPSVSSRLIYIVIIECSSYLIAACLPASYPVLAFLIPAPARLWLESLLYKLLVVKGVPKESELQPFGRRATQASFTRLMDTPGHSGDRSGDNPATSSKTVATLARTGAEASAKITGRGDLLALQGSDAENDQRIIVHTEIEVSQEERIVDLMGF